MVLAMASGASSPLRKTDSPRRVTSRSWCNVRRRPFRTCAILTRTELEPISTAAKTGIEIRLSAGAGWQHQRHARPPLPYAEAAAVSGAALRIGFRPGEPAKLARALLVTCSACQSCALLRLRRAAIKGQLPL